MSLSKASKKALGQLRKGKNALSTKLRMAKLGGGTRALAASKTLPMEATPLEEQDEGFDAFAGSILDGIDGPGDFDAWGDFLGEEAPASPPLFRETPKKSNESRAPDNVEIFEL